MGRHSTFTQEKADEILRRLSLGEPLAQICRDEGMPLVRTVSDWKLANADFDSRFARAREEGFDALAAQCLEIANTPLEGVETTTDEKGVSEKRGDMLGHRKLQIETRLKLLARWDPKRYGERTTIAGDPDAPLSAPGSTVLVASLTPEQLRVLAAIPLPDQDTTGSVG